MMSFKIYLLFFIFIYVKSVSPNPLNNNVLNSDILMLHINHIEIKCVVDIVKQEVPCGSFFTLVDGTNNLNPLIKQLSGTDCYNFIKRSPKTQTWLLRSNAYIILVENITELTEVFDILSKDFGWNPRAIFFIEIQHLYNEEYVDIFKILSRLNTYHVYLISTIRSGEVYVYNYYPFKNHSCGHVAKENIKIYSCEELPKYRINQTEIEYQLRNCPIIVLAKENPPNVIFETNRKYYHRGNSATGIEQYMLKNIAEQENYKLQYTLLERRTNFLSPRSDCIDSGPLKDLPRFPLAISMGGYVLMKKGSDCYDFIWGYCYANFHVYTSVRGADNWKKVYQVFGVTTWLLIGLSYCSVTVISFIVYSILLGKINKIYLALKMWGYLNNHPDQQLYRIGKLRFIMITWIWFSFFVINFYETAFYRLLTAPDKKGLTVKPEKLFSSSLKPCISFKVRSWFQLTFNVTLSTEIEDNCLYDSTALKAVTKNLKLFTLVSEPTYYKREYKYLDKFGHPKLDRWLFGTNDFIFSLVVNRGFPLLNKFQRYAFYHFESGLLLKHTEDTYHQFHVVTEINPVNLQDFKIHFTILFVGYIISFIIFIVEINQVRK